MKEILRLSQAAPIARGSERLVYAHPIDKDRLVKVLIPQSEQELAPGFRRFSQTYFPGLRLRACRKEWNEYQRVTRLKGARVPLAKLDSWIDTDLGPGIVIEKIVDQSGELAPSLRELVTEKRFGTAELALLNTFLDQMYGIGIRAGDASVKNIVFGYRPNSNTREALLIDGWGDIHAIPVRSMGRWANGLGLDDSFKRVSRRSGLIFNETSRQFEIPENW